MEPYDGVAELWWNHENEVVEAAAAPNSKRQPRSCSKTVDITDLVGHVWSSKKAADDVQRLAGYSPQEATLCLPARAPSI